MPVESAICEQVQLHTDLGRVTGTLARRHRLLIGRALICALPSRLIQLNSRIIDSYHAFVWHRSGATVIDASRLEPYASHVTFKFPPAGQAERERKRERERVYAGVAGQAGSQCTTGDPTPGELHTYFPCPPHDPRRLGC